MAVARNSARRESNVCVTLVPSDVTSVLISRSSARLELDEANGLDLERGLVRRQQQRDLFFERDLDRIALYRRHPGAGHRRHGRELHRMRAARIARPRDSHRFARGALHAARVMVLVAANPQHPSTSVRMPSPYDSCR